MTRGQKMPLKQKSGQEKHANISREIIVGIWNYRWNILCISVFFKFSTASMDWLCN